MHCVNLPATKQGKSQQTRNCNINRMSDMLSRSINAPTSYNGLGIDNDPGQVKKLLLMLDVFNIRDFILTQLCLCTLLHDMCVALSFPKRRVEERRGLFDCAVYGTLAQFSTDARERG